MIETWFVNDVKDKIDAHHRLVLTDVRGDGEFLLGFLPHQYNIIEAQMFTNAAARSATLRSL